MAGHRSNEPNEIAGGAGRAGLRGRRRGRARGRGPVELGTRADISFYYAEWGAAGEVTY